MTNANNTSGDTMSQAGGRARRRRTKGALLVGALALTTTVTAVVPLPGVSHADVSESEGIQCTTNATATFDVEARDGWISVPDGNSIYAWSYSRGAQATGAPFQFPGPVLCVNEGDNVTINLHNTLPVPTSIELPGFEDVKAGGVAAQPVVDVGTGDLTSLTTAVAPGATLAYTFKAARPGTYAYRSGTDPQLQVQMGLFSSIVVRARVAAIVDPSWPQAVKDATACAYKTAAGTCELSSRYDINHENLLMLSEIDPELHNEVDATVHGTLPAGASPVLTYAQYGKPYAPHYYMINGRSFPDTIAPNNAPWLPAQPYGSLSHVAPYDAATNPLDALIRYVGFGVTSYPFHPHSNHENVIATDAQLMVSGAGSGEEEKFAIMVNPGSTVDATFRWTNIDQYSEAANPVPAPYSNSLNLTEGDLWSGSPYLGTSNQLNPGINGKTQCGEYYHVAHSHDLSQATNYGASFGGMLTLIRVEPPDNLQDPAHKCNF